MTPLYLDILDYLYYYFKNRLVSLPRLNGFEFAKQSLRPDISQSFVLIRQYDESTAFRPDHLQTVFVQILVQAIGHDENARLIAVDVLREIPEQFGEIALDAPDGRPDEKITVANIRPIGGPRQIGNIGDGLFQYSLNYSITHGDC